MSPEEKSFKKQKSIETFLIIRLLLKKIPCFVTGSVIKKLFEQQGYKIIFCNIKVPKLIYLKELQNDDEVYYKWSEDYAIEYEEDKKYLENVEKNPYCVNDKIGECLIEIRIRQEEKTTITQEIEQFFYTKGLEVQWLEHDKQLNFTNYNFQWYPFILGIILQYFHSPPQKMSFYMKDNSYSIYFATYAASVEGYLKDIYDSFYCMKLALMIRGSAIEYAGPWKNDRQMQLTAIKSDSRALHYIESVDRNLSLFAVQQDGLIFKYLDVEFKNDIEIITAAKESILETAKNGSQIQNFVSHIPKSFLDDREFVLQLARYEDFLYEHLDSSWQQDRELILATVTRNGHSLKTFDTKFRNDKEIVIAALKSDPSAQQYIGESLKTDNDIIMLLEKINNTQMEDKTNLKIEENYENIVSCCENEWLTSMLSAWNLNPKNSNSNNLL